MGEVCGLSLGDCSAVSDERANPEDEGRRTPQTPCCSECAHETRRPGVRGDLTPVAAGSVMIVSTWPKLTSRRSPRGRRADSEDVLGRTAGKLSGEWREGGPLRPCAERTLIDEDSGLLEGEAVRLGVPTPGVDGRPMEFRSHLAVATCPCITATSNGRCPIKLVAVSDSPIPLSSASVSKCPRLAATCAAEFPASVTLCGFTPPLSSSSEITATLFHMHAVCTGLSPSSQCENVRASGSAPAARSNLATADEASGGEEAQAWCSGVAPCASTESTLALPARSSATISGCPVSAASASAESPRAVPLSTLAPSSSARWAAATSPSTMACTSSWLGGFGLGVACGGGL
mmetsp:Transcript_5315/g.12173  ORF Transcript_5315/g.12173 Transcript_5315/m.12173 type:complete len:347 (-) Transcript_5315:51-1091(-)